MARLVVEPEEESCATLWTPRGMSRIGAFAENIDPHHWTAATLLAGLDRGAVSRADVVRLFSERYGTDVVPEGSWQERLALLLPDEFDEVRAILVEAATTSRQRARDADIRPWLLLLLVQIRESWATLSDPMADLDDLLYAFGEPARYEVLRPWAAARVASGARHLAVLATLDVLIAEDIETFGSAQIRSEADRRRRSRDRLAFLRDRGLRLPGVGASARWLLVSVASILLASVVVGWLGRGSGDRWSTEDTWLLVAVVAWLSVLLRVPHIGVFVTAHGIRTVSLFRTRHEASAEIASIGTDEYTGLRWIRALAVPGVYMLTLERRDGRSRELPITMASNRRVAEHARVLSAISGIPVANGR